MDHIQCQSYCANTTTQTFKHIKSTYLESICNKGSYLIQSTIAIKDTNAIFSYERYKGTVTVSIILIHKNILLTT